MSFAKKKNVNQTTTYILYRNYEIAGLSSTIALQYFSALILTIAIHHISEPLISVFDFAKETLYVHATLNFFFNGNRFVSLDYF